MRINHLFFSASLFFSSALYAQTTYKDSAEAYLKDYVAKHEVVKGADKKQMHFFAVSDSFRILSRFEKMDNSPWFTMDATGAIRQTARVYGKVHFTLGNEKITLSIYQFQSSIQQEGFDGYLFLPFTDATCGKESYEGGRYIDLAMTDIHGDSLVLDFNKAYNPYCAYVSNAYSCPVPPKENRLSVAIRAGEKKYGKKH